MTQATTFEVLLGQQVRARRDELGMTQDELARKVGWTRAMIAALEGARRDVTIPQLLPLLAALETDLRKLLPPGQEVIIEDRWKIRSRDIADALGGQKLVSKVLRGAERIVQTFADKRQELETRAGDVWPGAGLADLLMAEAAATGEAETKAARTLGVDPFVLSVAAQRRWGQSLTLERDSRVSAQAQVDASSRTVQALRGHVTRSLIEELRPLLEGRRPR
jgi:transcriptional regulator with XRE-family HTH domain